MTGHYPNRCRNLFAAIVEASLILGLTGAHLPAAASPPAQEGDLRIGTSFETGKVTFIGANRASPFTLSGRSLEGFAAEEAGVAYIENFAEAIGLSDPTSELRLSRESRRNEGGRGTVRYQQVFRGVPVLAGELIVNTDDQARLLSISGEVSPDLSLSVDPEIDAEAARENALAAVAKWYGLDPGDLTASDPELWIYDERLLLPGSRPAELVWRTDVTGNERIDLNELVLVSARTGGISLQFNQIDAAKNRETYTASNGTTLPGTLVCNESNPTCSGGDSHAVAAHTYAGDTYDFYFTHHGRDGINNAGMTIRSTVHYRTGYANAFWNGSQMVYGDAYGFPLADDVVAHELTHGVTDYESDLFYYYQSGAINESFSDIWGEYVDLMNGAGDDSAGVKWLMGEDVSGLGALRDMESPPAFGDPDRMSSGNYYLGTGDNGGVHINSGINNKAAFLMTDGGSFNGYSVTGLGIDKVAAIYYDVQTRMLTSGSDYGDLYNALYQSCLDLVAGSEGITFDDCSEVRGAADAVEMDEEPATGFSPDAAICPAGMDPGNLFYDNIESGLGGWTAAAIEGISSWYDVEGYAHGGVSSLYGDDYWADYYGTPSDSYVAMNSDVSLPVGSSPYLWFAHAFGFEPPDYDGGWVEYSINGGGSWTDAGSLIDSGRDYNGSIVTGWGNPNEGHAAYVGASHGYASTRMDLWSLAGQSVRFRWRMSSDDVVYDLGWLVDDVRIYTCSAGPAENPDTPGTHRGDMFGLRNSNSSGYADIEVVYGVASDLPVVGDWDGDGVDTLGVFRDGVFYLRNSNSSGYADITFGYGLPGDKPIAGDWNADGIDTVGVFRNGVFYLRNSNTTGYAHITFGYGLAGDLPMSGDWDVDGVDTVGVFRNGVFYLRNSNSTGYADVTFGYGMPGDRPIVGDWDGDGVDTVGTFRSGVFYLRNTNMSGFADVTFSYGLPGDTPLTGDWDGLP